MAKRSTSTCVVVVLIALATPGCGGESEGGDPAEHGKPAPPAPAPHTATDALIIRRWADRLRRGDLEAATALFDLPATVQNGAGEIVLGSRGDVDAFNASLPCGAKLLYTTPKGPYTVGTFRLTERPGGDCGPGGGQKAATAFRILDGKIVEWLRVAVPPPPPREPRPEPKRPPSERVAPGDTV